eukprot:c24725_g1_i6 orf=621-1415(-)
MATVRAPATVPHPNQDCLDLHRAFEALVCDTKKVIDILGHRNVVQRVDIKVVYKNMYEEDLLRRLESELHFNLKKAMLLWMRNQDEQRAAILKTALNCRCVKDFRPLIETICLGGATEIQATAKAYYSLYGLHLEEDLKTTTFGQSQKLFLSYFRTDRPTGEVAVDSHLAQDDATELYNAGGDGKRINGSVLMCMLTSRSTAQLRLTFDTYKELFGQAVQKALKHKPRVEFEEILRAITKCIQYPERYFAKGKCNIKIEIWVKL